MRENRTDDMNVHNYKMNDLLCSNYRLQIIPSYNRYEHVYALCTKVTINLHMIRNET